MDFSSKNILKGDNLGIFFLEYPRFGEVLEGGVMNCTWSCNRLAVVVLLARLIYIYTCMCIYVCIYVYTVDLEQCRGWGTDPPRSKNPLYNLQSAFHTPVPVYLKIQPSPDHVVLYYFLFKKIHI